MAQIDSINRERATAVLVNFCHTNVKFGGKPYPPSIPQVIPYLFTEPDFKISALFSNYSDHRYLILYTDHTLCHFRGKRAQNHSICHSKSS